MIVSVSIAFTIMPTEKHRRQMQHAAERLTDSKASVRISHSIGDTKKLTARFTIPNARQQDVVDHIGRTFWDYIEDYANSSIGFSEDTYRGGSNRLL